MEDAPLKPCPLCGGSVTANYEGSSDWEIVHTDSGKRDDDHHCINVTIWVRASEEEWNADANAEWNKMAQIWNRRTQPGT